MKKYQIRSVTEKHFTLRNRTWMPVASIARFLREEITWSIIRGSILVPSLSSVPFVTDVSMLKAIWSRIWSCITRKRVISETCLLKITFSRLLMCCLSKVISRKSYANVFRFRSQYFLARNVRPWWSYITCKELLTDPQMRGLLLVCWLFKVF